MVVGGGVEAPDESAAMLGPVFVIEGGSTSISDSGNNVLRSVEDTRVDLSGVGEEILDGLNGDGVGVEGVAAGDGGNPDDVRAAGDS